LTGLLLLGDTVTTPKQTKDSHSVTEFKASTEMNGNVSEELS